MESPLRNCETVLGQITVRIQAHLKLGINDTSLRMSSMDIRWGLKTKNEVKDLPTHLA